MAEHEGQTREHAHPTTGVYLTVAAVLLVITLIEVGVFYIPAFHVVLAPTLLILSATKFALVVMFYMHLKSDHGIFRGMLLLPLGIAAAVMIALLFLFRVFG